MGRGFGVTMSERPSTTNVAAAGVRLSALTFGGPDGFMAKPWLKADGAPGLAPWTALSTGKEWDFGYLNSRVRVYEKYLDDSLDSSVFLG